MGKKKKSGKDPKSERKKVPNINDLEEADTAVIDFDKLVKNEYQRLLRQYRLMEDERHSVTAKGNALSKQARLLDLLVDEVRDIKTDLYNVDCVKNQVVDAISRFTILQLLEGYDKANEEQEFCLRNIRELSVHVDRIIKYLVNHKIKVQAIFGNSKTPAQMEKRRRVLENRLYFYTTRYCMKINENKIVRRDEINLSLKLRGLFHTRHTSLKRQLQDTKVKMGDVVFLATQAYDQRDELIATIRLIRERNDKENRQHVLEMKEFNRIIFNDTLIRGFLRQKLCNRAVDETEKQRQTRKNQNKLNMINRQLAIYTQSFRTILAKSKFTSMEGLINSYNETMQQNFSSFRSNCDLNHEIVFVRTETVDLSKEIEVQYDEYNQRQKKIQDEIEMYDEEAQREDDDLEHNKAMLVKAEAGMAEVLHHLDNLYTQVGLSFSSISRFLGNTDLKIKPRNAIYCMQLVETRVQELKLQEHELETRRDVEILQQAVKKDARKMEGGQKAKCLGGPYLATAVVSSIAEEGDEDDDDRLTLHPMAEKELRDVIGERTKAKHNRTTIFGGRGGRASTNSVMSTTPPSMMDIHQDRMMHVAPPPPRPQSQAERPEEPKKEEEPKAAEEPGQSTSDMS